MDIIFSDKFKKEYRKIKNKALRLKIIKQIKKLAENPKAGKPLKHELKNQRSLRVKPYRIIYTFSDKQIIILCIDHREDVY